MKIFDLTKLNIGLWKRYLFI